MNKFVFAFCLSLVFLYSCDYVRSLTSSDQNSAGGSDYMDPHEYENITAENYKDSEALPQIENGTEALTLYRENGEGGIQSFDGNLIIQDGQYYVELPGHDFPCKVYRVWDHADLAYRQKPWAQKYTYAIQEGMYEPYYFNMNSEWIPSLTDDPNDPYRITPIKKVRVYRGDGVDASDELLIFGNGKKMIYYGDDYFYATIQPVDYSDPYLPDWARNFQYWAEISGFRCYFNMD